MTHSHFIDLKHLVESHLEESIQRSVLHELCYNHHWLTCRGKQTKFECFASAQQGDERQHLLKGQGQEKKSTAVTGLPL